MKIKRQFMNHDSVIRVPNEDVDWKGLSNGLHHMLYVLYKTSSRRPRIMMSNSNSNGFLKMFYFALWGK